MRAVLKRGTSGIIDRLASGIESGLAEGSLAISGTPHEVAQNLYQLWLGASVMVKITKSVQPFETAMSTTRQLLNQP